MNRYDYIRSYWDKAAKDDAVDDKYICDVDTDLCLQDLGELHGRVLEIGCGVGRLLKDGYVGLEISEEMMLIATRRTGNDVVLGDGSNIPFEDGSFDTVYSYLVFQHLKPDEVREYITEAYRVLKAGGVLKFQFIEGDEREPLSNHYSIEEMKEFLTAAGFCNEPVIKLSVAHHMWTIMECAR